MLSKYYWNIEEVKHFCKINEPTIDCKHYQCAARLQCLRPAFYRKIRGKRTKLHSEDAEGMLA